MSDNTAIEWADATWNPITGCTLVSDGCRHCYAARLAATDGTTKADPTIADLRLAIANYEAGHELWKLMARIGKKAAGRLLDGVEHNVMPAVGLAKAESTE